MRDHIKELVDASFARNAIPAQNGASTHFGIAMRDATLPVLLIVGGFALLAWNFGWIPDWNTLIAIAFVCAGIAVMVFDGITKKSLVAGPILIAVGLGWYGYFELGWRSRLVIPTVMIFSGFMMLIARFAPIAESKERGVLAPRDKDATRF